MRVGKQPSTLSCIHAWRTLPDALDSVTCKKLLLVTHICGLKYEMNLALVSDNRLYMYMYYEIMLNYLFKQ